MLSLYATVVPTYLQTLGALSGLLTKAEGFCAEKGLAPSDLIQARLADDMHPFVYQVKSVAVHSLGAIEGVRRGVFSPDSSTPPQDFPALHAKVTATIQALERVEAAEVDSFVGRDMRFEVGDRRVDFTAENFFLSFSLPNFYFHAVTAYDILRSKGVQIGKRDYMGRYRKKS